MDPTISSDIREDLAPTGVLRASINLGNPVLAQGAPDSPSGVTIDVSRELAARLDVPLELSCFQAARQSFDAMKEGLGDICFLAIDPARQDVVAFTAAYAVIEAVFIVPADASRGHAAVPARLRGGAQGRRVHRRVATTLRPNRCHRRPALPPDGGRARQDRAPGRVR